MKQSKTPKFYQYTQNNSGGDFHFDKERGISHGVIIEALDYDEANDRAEDIGLYWLGCDSGHDCPCCGDRWAAQSNDHEARSTPHWYDLELVEGKPLELPYGKWMEDNYEVAVHYLDGNIKWW